MNRTVGNLALARQTILPTFQDAIGNMPVLKWFNKHHAIEQLLERGFAELTINPDFLEAHAPRIYEGLAGQDFGMVTDPLRQRFETQIERNDELGEDMESGLMKRTDDEHKWQFHYHCDIESWLRGQGAPVADYRDFWDSCKVLDDAAWEMAIAAGKMFDLYHSGKTSLEQEMRNGLRLSRILDYLANRAVPDAPDAKLHYDRGTLTPHWESTEPGLVVFDRQGKPHRMNETNRGTVLLFWGRKLGLMYEHLTDMVGTVHGVRDLERTTRKGTNRRAIVSFTHGTLNTAAVLRYRQNKARYKIGPEEALRYSL